MTDDDRCDDLVGSRRALPGAASSRRRRERGPSPQRRNPGRRAATALALALPLTTALSAGPLARAATGATTRPQAAAGCATSGLVVWLGASPGGAAAGSFYYQLVLTNLSGHTCTLTGYPGVSAVDLSGHQVGSAATRDAQHAAATITLARGASAVSVLRIVDVGNFPPTLCRPTEVAGLRVYPPNNVASKVVPYPFRGCGRAGTPFLSVEAVQVARVLPGP